MTTTAHHAKTGDRLLFWTYGNNTTQVHLGQIDEEILAGLPEALSGTIEAHYYGRSLPTEINSICGRQFHRIDIIQREYSGSSTTAFCRTCLKRSILSTETAE